MPGYQKKPVTQFGGLHISICFLMVIGNHMNGSGMVEAWVESGLLGQTATEYVVNGNTYKRAMHAHRLLCIIVVAAYAFPARVLPDFAR